MLSRYSSTCFVAIVPAVYGMSRSVRQQRSKATMKSAHLLPERREGKTKVMSQYYLPLAVLKPIWCLEAIHVCEEVLQQYQQFTVCAEGCETAEEQRDDEAHTLLT